MIGASIGFGCLYQAILLTQLKMGFWISSSIPDFFCKNSQSSFLFFRCIFSNCTKLISLYFLMQGESQRSRLEPVVTQVILFINLGKIFLVCSKCSSLTAFTFSAKNIDALVMSMTPSFTKT